MLICSLSVNRYTIGHSFNYLQCTRVYAFQLSTPKVKKMQLLLSQTMSSYYPAFCNMLETVSFSLEEAGDITKYLKPLRKLFEELEECDYLELHLHFAPIFHCICLIWANSTHYRQPSRLVVLLQEVSNLVIQLVHTCTCIFIHSKLNTYV